MKSKNASSFSQKQKIAILLPNPCNPDFRVIKQAESYADAGHDVRIYCRWAKGLPQVEKVNGVIYVRREITGSTLIKGLFANLKSRIGFVNESSKMASEQLHLETESRISEL